SHLVGQVIQEGATLGVVSAAPARKSIVSGSQLFRDLSLLDGVLNRNPRAPSVKLHFIAHLLALTVASQKVVIFTRFVSSLELIAAMLVSDGWRAGVDFERVSGQLTPRKRTLVADRFATQRHLRVLVATTGALAEGFNLECASVAVIYELGWN